MIEDRELLMKMLRRMMLIRRFDENVKELVQRGELVGAAHCYIVEEAVAVGACAALPVVVGAALGSKMQGLDRVVVSCFGDGASNQGACHEAMNLAAIWKLPVIFLCENNQYAVTTHFSDVVAVENISDRAAAYNMPGILVDGQDALATHDVTAEAVARARTGEGPSLIEARTYRYEDHSEGLGRILREPYRTDEEVDNWRKRDPIAIHQQMLLQREIATQEEIDQLQEDVVGAIEEALAGCGRMGLVTST